MQIAVVVDHQWIDFSEGRVDVDKGLDEPLGDAHELTNLRAAQPERESKLPGFPVGQSGQRVYVHSEDCGRVRRRHLLNVDAALGTGHQHQRLGRPVDHNAEVDFTSNVHGWRNKHAAHRLATDVQVKDL